MTRHSKNLGRFALCMFIFGFLIQIFLIYLGPSFFQIKFENLGVFPKLHFFLEILKENEVAILSSYLWLNLIYYIAFIFIFIIICFFYVKNSMSLSNFRENSNNLSINKSWYIFIFSMSAFGVFNLHYLVYRATWGRKFLSFERFDNFTNYVNSHILFNFISSSAFILTAFVLFLALFLEDWRRGTNTNA
jgi:hypothetical protein